ncbi:MAG: nucleotidyltransferase domain-containing protein [Alphaproteobacteria bacterium]|nr:nucleotidyltransferase domain-containing protein [Alphaproteobacteria bacterium]
MKRFRAALGALYGERLERAVLFGSRARGEGRADSDYDVAVFLRDMTDRWAEMDRLNAAVADILYSDFAFIHALPYRARAYNDATPLMQEIRQDGRDL